MVKHSSYHVRCGNCLRYPRIRNQKRNRMIVPEVFQWEIGKIRRLRLKKRLNNPITHRNAGFFKHFNQISYFGHCFPRHSFSRRPFEHNAPPTVRGPWSRGYDVALTKRRSQVQFLPDPPIIFIKFFYLIVKRSRV